MMTLNASDAIDRTAGRFRLFLPFRTRMQLFCGALSFRLGRTPAREIFRKGQSAVYDISGICAAWLQAGSEQTANKADIPHWNRQSVRIHSAFKGSEKLRHSQPERLGRVVTKLETIAPKPPRRLRRLSGGFLWDPSRSRSAPPFMRWLIFAPAFILRISPVTQLQSLRGVCAQPRGSR